MQQIIVKRVLPILVGALLGFAYYYYIGCVSGTCPITSSPYVSTIYGGLLGELLSFPRKRKKKGKLNENS